MKLLWTTHSMAGYLCGVDLQTYRLWYCLHKAENWQGSNLWPGEKGDGDSGDCKDFNSSATDR